MGKKEEDKLCLFDYGGISILIMGSTYPPIFYSFACEPVFHTRNIFLIVISVLSLLAFGTLFNSTLAFSEKFRPFRGIIFTLLGFSAIAPMIYLEFLSNHQYISPFTITPWIIGGSFYFVGAVMYILAIPERFKVKQFDILGGSH
jgi:adiponectin receptor